MNDRVIRAQASQRKGAASTQMRFRSDGQWGTTLIFSFEAAVT